MSTLEAETLELTKGIVEKRRLLGLDASYYWFDTQAYFEDSNLIKFLRSHEEIPKNRYSIKITLMAYFVSLTTPMEQVLAGFQPRARQGIKKAEKSGVVVQKASTDAEKLKFFDFYEKFAQAPQRQGKMLVMQKEELPNLDIFNAISGEGEYLGGIGILSSRRAGVSYYKYGATLHRFNENDLLVWRAIKDAKALGYSLFCTSTYIPGSAADSEHAKLLLFKKKFGGEPRPFYTYIRLAFPFSLGAWFVQKLIDFNFLGKIDRGLKRLGLFR
jgi:lipid II:glycine glycyltransferase (peptidoglycan interpeptide bridge formation enzyme)